MATTIALFNHKGGVSKTTTTFNLGWALASEGKKVLLVDLDSQCNLTGLILGYDKLEEGLDSFYESRENLTLHTIVENLIDGVPPESYLKSERGNVYPTRNQNLFLLPGGLNTSSLDSQISIALKIAVGIPATRNLPSGLPRLINSLANREGFDYVIYDMSPNVGGLNEVMIMSSDYFIVPTSPDFFCWQAVRSLSEHMKMWHAEIDSFKKATGVRVSDVLKNSPKFLGTVQQRYRIRNQAPAKSFEKWITEIRQAVDNDLVPTLATIGCLNPKAVTQAVLDECGAGLDAYDLAHIADFNSLIAISQNLSKPVFALADEDLKAAKQFGYALNTMMASRDSFTSQFELLAKIVCKLTV